MGKTKIGWTDYTHNPWMGCTKVSEGCKNCYAVTNVGIKFHRVKWGAGSPRLRKADSTRETEPLAWDRRAQKAGRRIKVFCASLADVFDDDPTQLVKLDSWRDDLFKLIAKTTNTDWQILTKRPQVALRYAETIRKLPQVWIGVSCENSEWARVRLPILAQIPASVRFVSAEPLIGELVFGTNIKAVDWVIVGGESGGNARPMDLSWARSIKGECSAARVPFFFKQVGSNKRTKGGHLLDGATFQTFPVPNTRRNVPFSAQNDCGDAAQDALSKNLSGRSIKFHRDQAGFSQDRLARSIGLARDAIAKIEGGTRCVSDKELLEIATALQTTPDRLLGVGSNSPVAQPAAN